MTVASPSRLSNIVCLHLTGYNQVTTSDLLQANIVFTLQFPPSVRRKVQGLTGQLWTPGREREREATDRHQGLERTAAVFCLPGDGDKKLSLDSQL